LLPGYVCLHYCSPFSGAVLAVHHRRPRLELSPTSHARAAVAAYLPSLPLLFHLLAGLGFRAVRDCSRHQHHRVTDHFPCRRGRRRRRLPLSLSLSPPPSLSHSLVAGFIGFRVSVVTIAGHLVASHCRLDSTLALALFLLVRFSGWGHR